MSYFLRVVFLKMHLPPENITITLYAHPIIGYQLQTFGMLYEVCLLLRNNNAISNLKSLFCPTPKNSIKNSLSLPLALICGITMAPITYHRWNVNWMPPLPPYLTNISVCRTVSISRANIFLLSGIHAFVILCNHGQAGKIAVLIFVLKIHYTVPATGSQFDYCGLPPLCYANQKIVNSSLVVQICIRDQATRLILEPQRQLLLRHLGFTLCYPHWRNSNILFGLNSDVVVLILTATFAGP